MKYRNEGKGKDDSDRAENEKWVGRDGGAGECGEGK